MMAMELRNAASVDMVSKTLKLIASEEPMKSESKRLIDPKPVVAHINGISNPNRSYAPLPKKVRQMSNLTPHRITNDSLLRPEERQPSLYKIHIFVNNGKNMVCTDLFKL